MIQEVHYKYFVYMKQRVNILILAILLILLESIVIGEKEVHQTGYFVGEDCIGCKLCYSVCPQKCIDISKKPVVINQNNCLHCGNCAEICPKQCIEKKKLRFISNVYSLTVQ